MIRLTVQNWSSAEELNRIKCKYHFSRLYPSQLLAQLCETLIKLGLTRFTLPSKSGKKMKVVINHERETGDTNLPKLNKKLSSGSAEGA